MKTILSIILFGAFLSPVFSQQKTDDLAKVKDGLVNYVLYSLELEKQNTNLKGTIQKIGDDLKLVKTLAQLDSLKKVYGIVEEKKEQKNDKTDK